MDTGLHYYGFTRETALEYFSEYAWDDTDVAKKEVKRTGFIDVLYSLFNCRGTVTSWLMRSTPDEAVEVRALLVGDIVLCTNLGKTVYSHSVSLHPGV